jgi:hypothetical protein
MGTPNSQLEQDLFRKWLCKGAKPSDQQLEESGLSLVMLERLHELIKPQLRYIPNKPMVDFTFDIAYGEPSRQAALKEYGLAEEKALELRNQIRFIGHRSIEYRAGIYLLLNGAWVTLSVTSNQQERQEGRYEWHVCLYDSVQAMMSSEPSLEPCQAEPTPALDLCNALHQQLGASIEERRRRLERQEVVQREMAHVLWMS